MIHKKNILILLLGLTLALAGLYCNSNSDTNQYKGSKITIKNGWAKQNVPGHKMSAAFLQLNNLTDQDEELLSAKSNVSDVTELHDMVMKDGMMSMTPVSKIKIAAKKMTELKPGGLHIMLIELKRDLKDGEKIQLTLNFKNAGTKTITVPVRKM